MKEQGLSFIELLAATTIVSIITIIAIPATLDSVRRQETQAGANLMIQSLALARQEAAFRRETVSVAAINESWQQGWLVFSDKNANAVMDDDDTLIQTQAPVRNAVIRGNGQATRYVMYAPDGGSVPIGNNGNAWASSTLSVCPNGDADIAYNILIAKGGRVRLERIGGDQCH